MVGKDHFPATQSPSTQELIIEVSGVADPRSHDPLLLVGGEDHDDIAAKYFRGAGWSRRRSRHHFIHPKR